MAGYAAPLKMGLGCVCPLLMMSDQHGLEERTAALTHDFFSHCGVGTLCLTLKKGVQQRGTLAR